MARLRFDLEWESPQARHRDSCVIARVNFWRDLLPPEIAEGLLDQPRGSRVEHHFAAGELVPTWREDHCLRAHRRQFNGAFTGHELVQPRLGRFYPRAILRDLSGALPDDRHPIRLVELAPEGLRADCNHPLAEFPLALGATIEDIWAPGPERGGRCQELADRVTAQGPGMQARWRDMPTDFWSDQPFVRRDPRPDPEFYQGPRLVDHLDRTAIAEVSALYGRLIPAGARILDLMTSWHSHLPEALARGPVTGLGMNAQELDANPVLTDRQVWDLNAEPVLSFPDGVFDAVVCTVSVEYLTQPFAIFREVARVLRPGGCFVTTFSNRCFPTKAIQVWEGLHEFERPALVLEYFLESALYRDLKTWSLRGLPRPPDDPYTDRLATADPVHAVWGTRV